MKIVLDTNVLLSGLFTRGVCEALLDAILTSTSYSVVLSKHILIEFAQHAKTKFGVPRAEVNVAIEMLRGNVKLVEPLGLPASVCRDKDDLPVLGTALAAKAKCLVTGDRDLLTLNRIQEIPIVSPRAFYDAIG